MPKKIKTYDEFIDEVRLNNLNTIKRIFNTSDEVTNCILENYNYQSFINGAFFTLREINESVFDFSERKNINSDIIYTMHDMQHDFQRKLYWKIWFESFAKAFERVENDVCRMSKKDGDKYFEWCDWIRKNYIVKKINKSEKRYLRDIYDIKNEEFDGPEFLKYYFKWFGNRQEHGTIYSYGESYLNRCLDENGDVKFEEMYSHDFSLEYKYIEEFNEWSIVYRVSNVANNVFIWRWNDINSIKGMLEKCKCLCKCLDDGNKDDGNKKFEELKNWLISRMDRMIEEIEYVGEFAEKEWYLRIRE